MKKTTIFLTGATGVMGSETLGRLAKSPELFDIRILSRPGKKNRRKLRNYESRPNVTVTYGDLVRYEDVDRAMGDADVVLHIGGMVSPMADHYPALAMEVNTQGAANIVKAIQSRRDPDAVHLVYIGSVAQTAHHMEPYHWGRTGDPIMPGIFDHYGISKIIAERIVAESGLRHWVSLRQSGILHKDLISRGSDPITFHVPLRGVLEWATVEDSGRLMEAICRKIALGKDAPNEGMPEGFWHGFFNIGSGAEFRLTNYEFEVLLLDALKCPPVEKIFNPEWFATRNFHGEWYADSDKLEEMFGFREKITAQEYFARMAKSMPWWMSLTPLAPAWAVKWGMKQIALKRGDGTLDWLRRTDCEDKVVAYFGSRQLQAVIPGWKDQDLSRPSDRPLLLDHGYDETKPDAELTIDDMRRAAEFRGGFLVSDHMETGDLETPLEWECARGHKFKATPRLVLKGGHWCPECLPTPWRYDEEAMLNPFVAQLWSHSQID